MIDDVLTMIPGPTPVHGRILDALARPTVSHVAPSFVESFRTCLANLRRIAMTDRARPFVVAGSGTLAMEMAVVNFLAPGERLLVVSHGYFGDRWGEVAGAFGFEHELLRAEWGAVVRPEELERRLSAQRFAAVAVTHVDTSTGSASPLEAYAERIRGRGALVLLDGVCATAGVEERFDDWGIDVLVTGAQKALGAPPGVAILLASERALARRASLPSVPAFSADLARWQAVMDDPSRYFSTPPVNEILALREATEIVLEEGLPVRFARHGRLARALRAGFAALGFEPFTREECLADTLSVLRHPTGVDDAAFRRELGRRGVVVAGALGPIAGQAFRVGHMGNIGPAEICRTLEAAEESLVALGRTVEAGAALSAAAKHFRG